VSVAEAELRSQAARERDIARARAAELAASEARQRGLAVAIDALTARLPIPVQIDVPDRRLPGAIEASVYFFCSEALTNIVKHAHATSASMRVEAANHRCAIEVRDDGIGAAQPRSETSGLNGLRDRIGALNGTMDITSQATGGTLLQASIPLSPESATPA
jgi:signal transduction histidine kinase